MRMRQIVFVYNAGSGFWNVALDMAHKIVSPATYPCRLCDLTYGIFKIRPAWDQFVRSSDTPLQFLHKDEFLAAWPHWANLPLPAVLVQENNELQLVIDHHRMHQMQSLDELMAAVRGI